MSGRIGPSKYISNNYSLDFDGVDEYLDLGSNSTVANGGQFSISFWVKGTPINTINFRDLFGADYFNNNSFWRTLNQNFYWKNINNNFLIITGGYMLKRKAF